MWKYENVGNVKIKKPASHCLHLPHLHIITFITFPL